MKRTYINQLSSQKGKDVTIKGWVHVYRDQGKMVFLDIRDMSGIVQGITLPGSPALETAKTLRAEWVVEISGTINERPEKMKKDIVNGDIEIEVKDVRVLAEALPPVFDITSDTKEIKEEVRLENRYLDLRSERMQKNLRRRHEIIHSLRGFLDSENFVEVETPMLTKTTPEGARDFLVPSRLHAGSFYALPQSPQQYKQLLMASGIEKYFQFARCFRDEDLRGDRQLDFTQLDLEMSFATEDDVMDLNERALIKLVTELYPEKTIQQIPFPRIPYKEAMEKYGNDRPDVREDKENPNVLAFCWVVDFPMFEKTSNSDDPMAQGEWTFTHNPFSAPKPEHMENLLNQENVEEILAAQYDIVLNGFEIGGGSVRNHKSGHLKKVLSVLGHKDEDIEKNFGHMLKAFSSGTPPHAGIAWGVARLVMILQNEPNIREVIAFPKNGEGRSVMMDSPSPVDGPTMEALSLIVLKKKGE